MKSQASTGWPPWPLWLVATVQICLSVSWLMPYADRPFYWWLNSGSPRIAYAVAYGAWALLLLVLCIPLLLRRRWTWSAFVAIFYVRLASNLARALALWFLAHETVPTRRAWVAPFLISRIPWHVTLALLSAACCLVLFRSGSWFGVEPRREWRTTFREGAWAWLLACLLGLVLPLLQMLRRL